MYSAGAQKRIMLIHDTTQELPASALRRLLHVFSLNPGDTLSLCGVFQLESKLKRLASIEGKNAGNRYSFDMDVLKKKQYENSWEMMQLSKLCDTQKVGFSIEITSGPSRNFLAVEAAKKSRATWVILDRKMKKDKNYFLKNLCCGISKMKQHNCIAQIRGPVIINDSIQAKMVLQTAVCTEDNENDDDLFSIEISPAMPSEVTKHRKAIATRTPRPLRKGIPPQKEIADSIIVTDSIDAHQLQWLIQVMRADPQRTLSMEKVIPTLQYIFDYKLVPSQIVAHTLSPLSESISTKEGHNESTREVLASPSSTTTRASDNSSENEFITYTEVAPSHELKREKLETKTSNKLQRNDLLNQNLSLADMPRCFETTNKYMNIKMFISGFLQKLI